MLGLHLLTETNTGYPLTSHSSEYLRRKAKLSNVGLSKTLEDYDEEVVKATAHAVMAASEKQSRTALTEIPLCLYHFASDCELARSLHYQPESGFQYPSTSMAKHSSHSRGQSCLSSHSINIASTHRPCHSMKPNVIRRKSFLGMPMSFDDTYNRPVLSKNEQSAKQFASAGAFATRLPMELVFNTRKSQSVRKPRGKSIKSLTREASQRINRPFRRMAASLRLPRFGTSGEGSKRPVVKMNTDPTSGYLRRRNMDGTPMQTPAETQLLRDNDGTNVRVTEDKSVSVTSEDIMEQHLQDDVDCETGFEERPSASAYLKEQFFSFFQPTGNKLAMKLFGTKMALDREKQRLEQQGRWIIHPCSNFR